MDRYELVIMWKLQTTSHMFCRRNRRIKVKCASMYHQQDCACCTVAPCSLVAAPVIIKTGRCRCAKPENTLKMRYVHIYSWWCEITVYSSKLPLVFTYIALTAVYECLVNQFLSAAKERKDLSSRSCDIAHCNPRSMSLHCEHKQPGFTSVTAANRDPP